MRWITVQLKDIAAPGEYSLVGGPFGSNLVRRDYQPEGVPVIRGSNLSVDGTFLLSDFVYVSEKKADELLANNAYPGDLVFTQRGTLGQVALIPKQCNYDRFVISQSQMKLTIDETKACPYFVYAYFRIPSTVEEIKNRVVTSGVPHINLETLRKFVIPLPPLDSQERIAGVISTYDDLIENNRRRMALLEEAMHLLYREWFVRLRFPGHEQTQIVDGVPDGWCKRPLASVAVVNEAMLSQNSNLETIGYIDISSVSTASIDAVTLMSFADAPSRARRVVRHGDILWSLVRPNRRLYCLVLNPDPNIIASTGFAVITSQRVPYVFLYCSLTTDDFVSHLTNVATGAAYPAARPSDIESYSLLTPTTHLLDEFNTLAEPMALLRSTLALQNDRLREARDLLLPRLMNGTLVV